MHTDPEDLEWDATKAWLNWRKHGIDFADAATALGDDNALTISDDAHGEQRFVTLGMDALGRLLVVVHTLRAGKVRLISARKATRAEASEYAAARTL